MDLFDGMDHIEIFHKLMGQSLDEIIKPAPLSLGDNPYIPMSFIDCNCITMLQACKKIKHLSLQGKYVFMPTRMLIISMVKIKLSY